MIPTALSEFIKSNVYIKYPILESNSAFHSLVAGYFEPVRVNNDELVILIKKIQKYVEKKNGFTHQRIRLPNHQRIHLSNH